MELENRGLWQALAGMRIEPEGARLSFAARLGREQRWSAGHTARVMEEYRRFLYLAETTGRPVTPSKQVDEAWHLHLTYTRHYWEELCGRILQRPLHHQPTEGGAGEEAHFAHQYRATLEAYRRAFGEAPPADIWPAADPVAAPAPRRARAAMRLGGAAAATFLLAACTALAAAADTEEEGDLLGGIIGIAIMAGIVYLIVRAVRRGKGGKGARRSGAAGGGAYAGYDASDDWNDRDTSGSDNDGGSSCGSSCGGGD